MTAPNHLHQAWINYGIDPITGRKALRDLNDGLVADPPGSTVGVHGLGVFYTHQTKLRFVIRDGRVWSVPVRKVVKLRPPKSSPTLLPEAYRVFLDFSVERGGTTWNFAFTSDSRATDFTLNQPAARSGETWKFYKDASVGFASYVFGHDTQTETQIKAIDGDVWSDATTLEGCRFEHSLRNVLPGSTVPLGAFSELVVQAADTITSPVVNRDDPTDGAKALAHFRARSLD